MDRLKYTTIRFTRDHEVSNGENYVTNHLADTAWQLLVLSSGLLVGQMGV